MPSLLTHKTTAVRLTVCNLPGIKVRLGMITTPLINTMSLHGTWEALTHHTHSLTITHRLITMQTYAKRHSTRRLAGREIHPTRRFNGSLLNGWWCAHEWRWEYRTHFPKEAVRIWREMLPVQWKEKKKISMDKIKQNHLKNSEALYFMTQKTQKNLKCLNV